MIRLGVFTDAHYAEGLKLLGTRTCGKSLGKVRRILGALRETDAFVQLGDLINASGDAGQDRKNITAMQALLSQCASPCYSVLGNHDVEAARKSVFLPECEKGYYYLNWMACGLSYWTAILPPGEQAMRTPNGTGPIR